MKKDPRFELATRELVDSLIERIAPDQRPIRTTACDRYARDMAAGNWIPTNQGIGIDSTGAVFDGQHRLYALRQAGYPPVELLIVRGLDPSCRIVVDGGVKRSFRDLVHYQFNARVHRSAGAVATAILLDQAHWARVSISQKERYDCVLEHQEVLEAVLGLPKNVKFFPCPFYAAWVVCLTSGIGTINHLATFVADVESGENLQKNQPQYHLRNLLFATKARGGGASGSIQKERFKKAKRAFVAYVAGEPMFSLRARD